MIKHGSKAWVILDYLYKRSPHGAGNKDLRSALKMLDSEVSPRLIELFRAGYIECRGARGIRSYRITMKGDEAIQTIARNRALQREEGHPVRA